MTKYLDKKKQYILCHEIYFSKDRQFEDIQYQKN